MSHPHEVDLAVQAPLDTKLSKIRTIIIALYILHLCMEEKPPISDQMSRPALSTQPGLSWPFYMLDTHRNDG